MSLKRYISNHEEDGDCYLTYFNSQGKPECKNLDNGDIFDCSESGCFNTDDFTPEQLEMIENEELYPIAWKEIIYTTLEEVMKDDIEDGYTIITDPIEIDKFLMMKELMK